MVAASWISTLVCVLLAIAGGVPVEVTTATGKQTRGTLVRLTETDVVIDENGTTQSYPFDSVVTLEATSPLQVMPPKMRVSLHGGSELAAQSVSLTGDAVTVDLSRQDDLTLPVKRVHAIRLRAGTAVTDPQWFGIVENLSSRDLLVIRRDAEHLDQISGVVESIAESVVNFNVDGSQVQAPFDRLEGVVFGASSPPPARASIQLNDSYGSRWMVDGFVASEDPTQIRIKFESGIEHALPLNQVLSIRWNSSIVMLAGEAPATTNFQPVISSQGLEPAMKKWFGPSAASDDDVLLYGNSSVEYRINPGYEHVTGSFRHDDHVSRASQVTVSVLLDDESVWTQTLLPNQTSGFHLPIGDQRRLTFRVDAADDGDLGDTIRLCRPRLLK